MADEPKTANSLPQTQEELDTIIENRLARERKKLADELSGARADAEKARGELSAKEEKLKTFETLSATATEREKLVEEVYAGLLGEIPDEARDLVPATLSKEDQIRYIQKNKSRLHALAKPESGNQTVQQIQSPNNPPDKNRNLSDLSLIPGGYKSEIDFAQRDHKGYLEWVKKQARPT